MKRFIVWFQDLGLFLDRGGFTRSLLPTWSMEATEIPPETQNTRNIEVIGDVFNCPPGGLYVCSPDGDLVGVAPRGGDGYARFHLPIPRLPPPLEFLEALGMRGKMVWVVVPPVPPYPPVPPATQLPLFIEET